MPTIHPEAMQYLGQRITSAKAEGNIALVDALLDMLLDHQVMADDTDAAKWGFNPDMWALPTDLLRFKRMPHPTTARLKR